MSESDGLFVDDHHLSTNDFHIIGSIENKFDDSSGTMPIESIGRFHSRFSCALRLHRENSLPIARRQVKDEEKLSRTNDVF